MLGDRDPTERPADMADLAGAAVRVGDLLETIAAELYRVRVAVEVMAGEALDRETSAHPAGAELRYLGRLGTEPEWRDPYGTSE